MGATRDAADSNAAGDGLLNEATSLSFAIWPSDRIFCDENSDDPAAFDATPRFTYGTPGTGTSGAFPLTFTARVDTLTTSQPACIREADSGCSLYPPHHFI